MLHKRTTNSGYEFTVEENGELLYFNDWDASDACIYYMPLVNLVDNGYASCDGEVCRVPFESIYQLDNTERRLLGFPCLYPFAIRLRSVGDFKSQDFCFEVDYLTYREEGDVLSVIRDGCEIDVQNYGRYLLNEEQYIFKRLVDDFNSNNRETRTFENILLRFAEIKKAALRASVVLDSYLEQENVYVPDMIKLEISRDNDNSLVVLPAIDIVEKEKFKQTFQRQRRILDVYPIADDSGNRTRVVLTESQKKNLTPLKNHNCRYSELSEIQHLIEQPTEYFDPNVFDLSEFYGERVIDLGFYKPRFYPFVSPYRSVWIAGADITHPTLGTSIITIRNQEELEELEMIIHKSIEDGRIICEYKETELDINDAKLLVEMARKQLASPNNPIKLVTQKDNRKVLIIEENTETTAYSTGNHKILSDGQYALYKNANIADGYNLKRHQEEGVAWLQHLKGNNSPGCLIAEDMGLGKTLQILYFIDWHSQLHPTHKPYLIVAPVSLIENWNNEYARFFQRPMAITILTSSQVPRGLDRNVINKMQGCEIILTNYETIRNCQLNFCAVDFEMVVLDEAQKIKTPGTLVTNAVKALKSTFRIAMTGTPVENTLLDLWCIMDFCVPGLLGNAKEFAKRFQNPLREEDTNLISLGNEIRQLLGVYFIRRLKSDAAEDLPKKTEINCRIEMPDIQENMYNKVVSSYNPNKSGDMLVTIMGIRTVSEHPYLYDESIHLHDIEDLVSSSARLIATISILEKIKEKGEKAIIFAERKDSQKMLQKIIKSTFGYTAKIINGETPTSHHTQSRQTVINDFQKQAGYGYIIMSPIAAGVGLNVTSANHIIHYSRHWNPAKENQATDRAYRIGQDKDVYVYYPMAVSQNFKSFDTTLAELLSRKAKLATATIFPTERIELRPDDFGEILKYR